MNKVVGKAGKTRCAFKASSQKHMWRKWASGHRGLGLALGVDSWRAQVVAGKLGLETLHPSRLGSVSPNTHGLILPEVSVCNDHVSFRDKSVRNIYVVLL